MYNESQSKESLRGTIYTWGLLYSFDITFEEEDIIFIFICVHRGCLNIVRNAWKAFFNLFWEPFVHFGVVKFPVLWTFKKVYFIVFVVKSSIKVVG